MNNTTFWSNKNPWKKHRKSTKVLTAWGNVGAAAPTWIALNGPSDGYPRRPSPATNKKIKL